MDMARKEQEETEQLLIELFIAEADRKIEEEAKAREERRLRLKQEMMEANRLQQILGAERRRQEKEEEDVCLRIRILLICEVLILLGAAIVQGNDGEVCRG